MKDSVGCSTSVDLNCPVRSIDGSSMTGVIERRISSCESCLLCSAVGSVRASCVNRSVANLTSGRRQLKVPEDRVRVRRDIAVAYLEDQPAHPRNREARDDDVVGQDWRTVRPADGTLLEVRRLAALHGSAQEKSRVSLQRQASVVVALRKLPDRAREYVRVDRCADDDRLTVQRGHRNASRSTWCIS